MKDKITDINVEDLQFDNRYVMSREILAEYYRSCVFKKYGFFGWAVILLGTVQLLTIVGGWMGVFESSLNHMTRVVFFDLGLIFVALGILMKCYYRIVTRISLRQMKKMSGGELPEIRIQLGDCIILDEGKYLKRHEFQAVSKLVETKHLYVLVLSKLSAVILSKDGFQLENGDFTEFISRHIGK